MLKNYFTVAVRNLLRYKGYSLINVFGLAIGMTCCVLMLLLVQNELSYDRQHVNGDRIFRLINQSRNSQTGAVRMGAIGPYRLAEALRTDFPDWEVVRFSSRSTETIRYGDKRFTEHRCFLADPNVFEVFTFPLVEGDPKTALQDPSSVVITQAMAKKFFGDADPMGKRLTVDNDREVTVTGVAADLPENMHLHFDFLGSMTAAKTLFNRLKLENWGEGSVYTYAMLPKWVTPKDVDAPLVAFVKKNRGEEAVEKYGVKLVLQPLTSIHLYSHTTSEIEPNGDIVYVYAFSAIAFFVLLIACINFMNLATARSANRAREVGLRKVVGAFRGQLIRQFISESVLLAVLAMLLAVALVELVLPWFNGFVGKNLSVNYANNPTAVLGLVGITLFVGMVAGAYPALFLSRFEPVVVLKGASAGRGRGAWLRQGLVAFQFAISVFLIVVTGVIHDQLAYARQIKLGYDTDQVVVLPGIPDAQRRDFETVKQAWMSQVPGLLNMALTSRIPSGKLGSSLGTHPEGIPEDQRPSMQTVWIGFDFFKTLGMTFAAGRSFSSERASDATSGFVINEAACRELGWTPEAAVGKGFGSQYIDDWQKGQWKWKDGHVIGVVKDVYFESLHEPIKPMVFSFEPYMAWSTVARISTDHIQETLDFLKQQYRALSSDPDAAFSYSFLNDRFARLYQAEEKQAQIFGIFSALAIFVGCLGLLGLAAFTAEQRTKEIGIRKVLGASSGGIVTLLSKDFVKLVLVANVIAWPVAYWAMHQWLQNFAYRTALHIGTFALGGLLALVIAVGTVSYQAVKASLINPVDALHYE